MKTSFLFLAVILVLSMILSQVESSPHPNEHCECHYQSAKKGCRIARGSSVTGYKCQCRVSSFFVWTHCIGARVQCNTGENCPANCTSHECCVASGGDCKGY